MYEKFAAGGAVVVVALAGKERVPLVSGAHHKQKIVRYYTFHYRHH